MRLPVLVGERDPVLRAGRRALALMLVGGLVGAAVALGWYVSRPLQYSSTIALELSSVTAAVDLNPTGPQLHPVTVDTDALIMVSDDVATAVARTVGGTPEQTRADLSVRARPQSRVLEITYTTEVSDRAAREGVTSAAEAYLDQRERLIIDPVRTYVGGIIDGTAEIQTEDPASGETVAHGQTALENRLERAQAYQIRLPQPGLVVASATEPAGRRGTFNVVVVSGALLGALLGFGAGLAWEHVRGVRRLARRSARRLAAPEVPRELVSS
jgi:hypothetical protein